MEYFRFTLFNNITLLIMGLTLALAFARWRGIQRSSWPLLYYAVLAAYAVGFDGSLNKWLVAAGLACGILLRFRKIWQIRFLEVMIIVYVLWRTLGLLLLW